MKKMKKECILGALCLAVVLVATSLWAADAPATTSPSGGEQEASLTEINRTTFWVSEQGVVMNDKCRGKEKRDECRGQVPRVGLPLDTSPSLHT